MTLKIKTLVVSKDLRFGGGVANFLAMQSTHVSEFTEWEHFKIGEPYPGKKRLLIRFTRPIVDNIRLFIRLLKRDIDCLHINPSMNRNAFARDALLLITTRLASFNNVVVFLHGWDEGFANLVANKPVYRFLFRQTFAKAFIVIVLAKQFEKKLTMMGMNANRISVESTMFDGAIFKEIKRKKEDNFFLILFLARFVKEKGVYELLEAFLKIREQIPNVRLVMAGDGPERLTMEKWVEKHNSGNHILFPGYLRGAHKAQALLNADLFVFPTYHGEGCPVALLEAMAAGLPIVTTAIGGIQDIFRNGRNGILIDYVTPQAIKNATIQLLSDEKLLIEVGQNNKKQAWANFEASIVTARLETIYRYAVQHGETA